MKRINIGKWSIIIRFPQIITNEELDHKCLNQVMDGTYSCEFCYPPCKKCGRDTSEWGVNCNSVDGCELEK